MRTALRIVSWALAVCWAIWAYQLGYFHGVMGEMDRNHDTADTGVGFGYAAVMLAGIVLLFTTLATGYARIWLSLRRGTKKPPEKNPAAV